MDGPGWLRHRVLSLRLAVPERGAKPTDPWTALDVAQTVETSATAEHHSLNQVDRHRPGRRQRRRTDARSGRQRKPSTATGSERLRSSSSTSRRRSTAWIGWRSGAIQDQSTSGAGEPPPTASVARRNTWFIETIQRRDRDRPHPATFRPAAGAVSAAARVVADSGGDGPVHRPRQHRGRVRPARCGLHRLGDRRDV